MDEDSGLSIAVDDEYYRLTIFYGSTALKEIKSLNHKWLIYVLCHEIAHVYTHSLYRKGIGAQTHSSMKILEEVREQTTERVSRLIEALYRQDQSNLDGYRKYKI